MQDRQLEQVGGVLFRCALAPIHSEIQLRDSGADNYGDCMFAARRRLLMNEKNEEV